MKTSCLAFLLLSSIVAGAQAADTATQAALPPPTAYSVTEYGDNHRVWERTVYEQGPNGTVVPKTNRYTELATGMYYQSNGQWVESKEEIDAYPQGAIAQQGPYQVIFANNLNSAGAIDQQTPDGKRLRSSILGLAYYDKSTTNSVLIAQIQNSQGELISSNQVLYPNAFAGVKADVRYTYKRGTFEQDVILREQPPTPESLGLNAQTTEIEVLTEFINPPETSVVERQVRTNSLPDQDISWGATRIGRGKAFDLGDQQNPRSRVPVRRQYVAAQGRNILVEGAPMTKIQPHLTGLPLQLSAVPKLPVLASKTLVLPKTPLAQAKGKPMKLASAKPANQGYVLDYVELNSSTNDYTFESYETYHISGFFDVSGTLTLGDGAVIKIDESIGDGVECDGTIIYSVSDFAYFTSANDNSIGETISGSSGSPVELSGPAFVPPVNYFYNLNCSWGGVALGDPVYAHDSWFHYCNVGNPAIDVVSDSEVHIYNMEFDDCVSAVYTPNDGLTLYATNIFMFNSEDLVEFPTIDSTVSLFLTGYTAINSGCPSCMQDICALGISIIEAGGQFYWSDCMNSYTNGLPIWWQLQYFGNFDQSATGDYSGDGLSNLKKYQNGLDPTVFYNAQLAYWRFDNTNTWVGDQGQLPLVATNVFGVPSWSTNAGLIDSNGVAMLQYHSVETSGDANILCSVGTLRFWFKPDWDSGTGPGSAGRLIELGNQTNTSGWWGLIFNTNGTQITFGTQTNGLAMTNLTESISWTANTWHQIALVYSSSGSTLCVDGSTTNGAGVTYCPNAYEQSLGLRIGSDSTGNRQARGAFDEMQIFNYNYLIYFSQVMDSNLNGLPDWWEIEYFGNLNQTTTGDYDGDGISNLQKYEDGIDPTRPAFHVSITRPGQSTDMP